jgi:hypothetical protein
MATDRPLAALYYPYADVLASQSLLEACLLFDVVYVFEPNFFRAPQGIHGLSVPHGPEMSTLVDAHVIQPIGPKLVGLASHPQTGADPLAEDYRASIKGLIAHDRTDPSLAALCAHYGMTSWEIPTGQQLYWNGLGLLLGDTDAEVRIHSDRADYYSSYMENIGLRRIPIEQRTERRIRASGDLQVRVPFLEAQSLMTTLTIAACAELDLDPITDSRFQSEFMTRKLRSLQEYPGLGPVLNEVAQPMKAGVLGLESMRVNIPHLEGLSAESVLVLRSKCSESLTQFRSHMRALRYQLESQPWSNEFSFELEKMVEGSIVPSVHQLESDLRHQTKALGVQSLSTIITAAPLPLMLTFAAGLPAWIALAVGAGAAAATEAARYWLERQKQRRHGLYFLIDARP